MDTETLKTQMKAMKKKAADAKAAGQAEVSRQFHKASSRLWRKLKKVAPQVAEKIEQAGA